MTCQIQTDNRNSTNSIAPFSTADPQPAEPTHQAGLWPGPARAFVYIPCLGRTRLATGESTTGQVSSVSTASNKMTFSCTLIDCHCEKLLPRALCSTEESSTV